jgi:endonuclease-3
MGYLVLEHAWNLSTGIGVDIHVERITNRLGWHPKPTNVPAPTPELARCVHDN